MVYAGFRDARRNIPDPPPAKSAPDQHDEENMHARPDQEEMEQAINKFLQRLEKQEGLQGPGHSTVTVAQACTRVR